MKVPPHRLKFVSRHIEQSCQAQTEKNMTIMHGMQYMYNITDMLRYNMLDMQYMPYCQYTPHVSYDQYEQYAKIRIYTPTFNISSSKQ